MLATTSIGAVWSSCSPDFGAARRARSLRPDRAEGAVHGRRLLLRRQDARLAERRCAACSRACRRSNASSSCRTSPHDPDIASLPHAVHFADFGTAGATLEFTRVPFDAPLYILYSSGTTGVPKCIVHGVGGTLLQHRKEHVLHADLQPRRPAVLLHDLRLDDVELAGVGARLGLHARALRRLAVRVRTATCCGAWPSASASRIFGTSPKYLARACRRTAVAPRDALRPRRAAHASSRPARRSRREQFDFVYRERSRPDVQLASISGGTDIVSCFALGNPVAAGLSRRDCSAAASA